MAVITLTDPLFYKAGVSGKTRVVGYESSATRVVRYAFTAPEVGASQVELCFRGLSLGSGQAIALRYHITTDPEACADPSPGAAYTGTLTMNAAGTEATAQASLLLLPSTTYYLWVFPGVEVFGWYSWILEEATLTTSGGSCSSPSLSASALDLGQTLTISTNRLAAFTHTLTWRFGDASGTIAQDVTDSCTWVPPVSLAAQVPNGVCGTAVITCQTYHQDTRIGEPQSITVTLQVPESVVPWVQGEWQDTTGAAGVFGGPVQQVSRLEVAVTAQGSYGSTIVSRSVTLEGRAYTGGILTAAGEQTLTVTVTDSRGRIGVFETVLTVLAYTVPSLTLTAHRCDSAGNADDTGEYAAITVTGEVSTLSGNTAALTVTADQSYTPEISPGQVEYTQVVPAPSVAAMTITAVLTDALCSLRRSMVLSVGYATMDFLAGGKGIAFGATATKEGFTCAMDTDMSGKRLYNLPLPQTAWDAAPRAVALPLLGTLTADAAELTAQGLFLIPGDYGYDTGGITSGQLVLLGDPEEAALQLVCDFAADTVKLRTCWAGQWNPWKSLK